MADMNWIKELINKPMQQVEVDQLVDLHLINRVDTNLAFHKRGPDAEILSYVNLLLQYDFKGINSIVNCDNLNSVLSVAMDEFGFQTEGKIKLKEDIRKICEYFFSITQASNLRLILKVVNHNACAKFHTDAYDLRLLCTYVGSGTEWVSDQHVNRKKLINGTNEEIIRDFTKVRSLKPFDVAILKGEIPTRPGVKGIVHRSPSIEHTGEKRLLLRLDY
jgi:Protein of unknown function (DUF1826)